MVIPLDLTVYFSKSQPEMDRGAGKMIQLCSQQQVFIKQLPMFNLRDNFNISKDK